MTGTLGSFALDARARMKREGTWHDPPSEADRLNSQREYAKGVLDDALVIVAELGVPADLAPVALAKAIDLLAGVKD